MSVKESLKEEALKLYESGKNEEIADLLMNTDEVRNNMEIGIIFARSLIDISEENGEELYEGAEAVLLHFYEQGVRNGEWHYQLARACFAMGRIADALSELALMEALSQMTPQAKELKRICADDMRKRTSYYNKNQRGAVLKHLEEHFGKIERIIPDPSPSVVSAEIAVIKKTGKRRKKILATVGMGAYEMMIPREISGFTPSRAELVMYIPLDASEELEEAVCAHMRMLTRLPAERSSWVAVGHVFSNGSPMIENTGFTSEALVALQTDNDDEARICFFSQNDSVAFYQLLPIYEDEMKYKIVNGIDALLKKLIPFGAVLDVSRKNSCEGYTREKEIPLLGKEIDFTSELNIGKYCAASKQVAVEGRRVGFMKRIIPESFTSDTDDELAANDSGWLFLSGEESREYLSDPYSISLYRINTICNIDSDIVRFLSLPYGTEVIRRPNGELIVKPEEIFSDENGSVLPPS